MQINISKVIIGSLSIVGLLGSDVMAQRVRETGKREIEKREVEKREIEQGKKETGTERAIKGSAPLASPGVDVPASGSVTSSKVHEPSIEKLGAVCGVTAGGQAAELMNTASDAEVASVVSSVKDAATQLSNLEAQIGVQATDLVDRAIKGAKSLKGDSDALAGDTIAFKAQIEATKSVLADKALAGEIAACRSGSAAACSIVKNERDNRGVLKLISESSCGVSNPASCKEAQEFKNNCLLPMGLAA